MKVHMIYVKAGRSTTKGLNDIVVFLSSYDMMELSRKAEMEPPPKAVGKLKENYYTKLYESCNARLHESCNAMLRES